MWIVFLLALTFGPADPVRSEECVSCHAVGSASHPVGFVYAVRRGLRNPPPGLLVDGRVECTTCHLSHENETSNRFRLRVSMEQQVELCTACHDLD
jgi:predicted CXXCH cytochrome family protein